MLTISPRYGDPYYRAEEEVGEGENQWKEMKEPVKEIQPEDLEEVMLEEAMEGELAEGVYPKVHLTEMKGITRLENCWSLQMK